MLQTHSPHTEVCYSTVVKQLDKSLDDVFKGEYHKEKIVGELSSKVSMEFLEVTHSGQHWEKCKSTFIAVLQIYLVVKPHHTLSKQSITDDGQSRKLLKITHF